MENKSCTEQIKSNYLSLRPSEEKVANFVLTNMESIPKISIGDLANIIGVSQPTIVRFVKRVGYDGYREFKDDIIIEIGKKLKISKEN